MRPQRITALWAYLTPWAGLVYPCEARLAHVNTLDRVWCYGAIFRATRRCRRSRAPVFGGPNRTEKRTKGAEFGEHFQPFSEWSGVNFLEPPGFELRGCFEWNGAGC
eukprot:CAMPEP_0184722818 /NCGR_PEP_ID=MMETSP0314-20130426/23361_1 /TAXON_ID=38298 /ORGANISM="Rhodella maculata, Strain CCMP 736" /LENGTH=106 /DNA_ID=CAMNT_0027187491 /DNA_START=346 /DNA_END=663 /DNA_ORIENTATION=-